MNKRPFRLSLGVLAVLLLAALPSASPAQPATQPAVADHVFARIVVVDDLQPKPVPFTDFRIARADGSDPRVVRTDENGYLHAPLGAGDYVLRSVRPVEVKGRQITWDRPFTISATRNTVLTITDADADAAKPQGPRSANPTVAVVPWIFVEGTSGAMRTARETLDAALTKSGLEVVPHNRADAAWARLGPPAKPGAAPAVASARDLLRFGHEMGVDYVAAGKAVWHTRSLWIGLGPKTKSDCTIDLAIVDVRKSERALDARGVRMDSTAKEEALKAAGAILVTPLVTVVSGGPKTPHEQRAAQLAITKALQPWLAARAAPVTDDRHIR